MYGLVSRSSTTPPRDSLMAMHSPRGSVLANEKSYSGAATQFSQPSSMMDKRNRREGREEHDWDNNTLGFPRCGDIFTLYTTTNRVWPSDEISPEQGESMHDAILGWVRVLLFAKKGI